MCLYWSTHKLLIVCASFPLLYIHTHLYTYMHTLACSATWYSKQDLKALCLFSLDIHTHLFTYMHTYTYPLVQLLDTARPQAFVPIFLCSTYIHTCINTCIHTYTHLFSYLIQQDLKPLCLFSSAHARGTCKIHFSRSIRKLSCMHVCMYVCRWNINVFMYTCPWHIWNPFLPKHPRTTMYVCMYVCEI